MGRPSAPADVHERIAANRRRLADFFGGLDDAQLSRPSLCEAWTVSDVLGHLVMPLATGAGTLLRHLVRARGSLDRANASLAQELGQRPVGELTGLLREHAETRVGAPGVGPRGQLADTCVHLRDCARPLGLPDDVTLGDWRVLLDWMPSGVPGLVPKKRAAALALAATDQDWSWGTGPEVHGSSEALVLALAGRRAALDDLAGDGVAVLRERIHAD